MAGLNGWFGRNFWKKLAKVAIIAAATSFGGGILGAIAAAALTSWRGGGENNPHVQNEIDIWTDLVFVPYYKRFIAQVSNNVSVAKLNSLLEELYAWKAYYEFVALKATDEDEVLIATEKALLIGDYGDIVKGVWLEQNPTDKFFPYPFNPKTYTKISGNTLDWTGASSVVAEKYIVADSPYNDGSGNGSGGVIIPIKGGGSSPGGSTGGGSSTGGPTKGQVPPKGQFPGGSGSGSGGVIIPVKGGGASTSGSSGSGSTGGVGTQIPGNTPRPTPTQEPKSNNNKTLIMIVASLGLLALFKSKK